MRIPAKLVIENPANTGVRRYFERRFERRDLPAVASPDEVPNPYMRLGTHPDLIERLWDQLGKSLRTDCRAVFFGTPALIHPKTGVVFGFAGGTQMYALRFPAVEREEAIRAGASPVHHFSGSSASFDLSVIGEEWLFCRWHRDEERWCQAAFDYAGTT